VSKKAKWAIFGGAALLLVALLFVLTREPAPPFKFIAKYPLVESKETTDGRRFVVLKGDMQDVARDAEAELGGDILVKGSSTSGFNDLITETRSFGTKKGSLSISSDISGATFDNGQSFDSNGFMSMNRMAPGVLKEGYCAVAYTRPKSLFDRAIDWVRGLFGGRDREHALLYRREALLRYNCV